MSSWLNLSGNLSSNISTLTGHISNFTREVLTEGTEEIYDQEAELSIAKAKIRELEARVNNQKNEWERINKINEELQDRAESAELQIRAMSGEYRIRLDEKENELKQLRQAQSSAVNSPVHKAFNDSWMDVDDGDHQARVVSQLQREIADLHADCRYWKDVAHNKQNADADLESLKQEHQQRLTSLLSTYTQKLNKLKRKHKTDMEELQKEKDSLKAALSMFNDNDGLDESDKANDNEANLLEESLKIAEETIKSLKAELMEKTKSLEKFSEELNLERSQYESQLKDKEEMIISFDDEIRRLTKTVEEKDAQIMGLQEEVIKVKDCLYNQELENGTYGKAESLPAGNTRQCVEKSVQTALVKDVFSNYQKEVKEIQNKLFLANDENVSLTLENNKLTEKLQKVLCERDAFLEETRDLREANRSLSDTVSCAELEREAVTTERDGMENSFKELEELRYEIARLESWTNELVEDLEISKEVQSEQSFELESLRHICQLKGEPQEEIKRLRSNVQRLAVQYMTLFKQYQKVTKLLREAESKLLEECTLRREHAKDVRQEIAKVRRKFLHSQESKLASCLDEKEKVEGRLVEVSEQVCKQEDLVTELQLDSDYLSQETVAMVSDFGCQVNSNMENNVDTIESLRAEKAILERTIEGLERRAGTLEDMFADIHDRKRQSISRFGSQEHKKRLSLQLSAEPSLQTVNSSTSNDDPDKPSMPDKEQSSTPGKDRAFSPCSVGSQDGSYFDDDQPRKLWNESDPKVAELEGHVADLVLKIQGYENFVAEFGSKERDWNLEKTAMENMIIDLQKRVKHQDAALPKESQSLKSAEKLISDNTVQVQNRGAETDLTLMDIEELLQLTSVNRELSIEIETQRKVIIGAEHCLIDIIDKLRTLVNDNALKEPELVSRLSSIANDKHSSTYKRFEKVTYLVEVLTKSRETGMEDNKQAILALEENKRLVDELAFVREEAKSASEQVSALSSENEALRVALSDKDLKFKALDDRFRNLVNERDKLRVDLDNATFDANNTRTELQSHVNQINEELVSMSKMREQLLADLSDRDESLIEQKEKYDSLLDQIMDEKDKDLLDLQEQQEQIMDLYKKKQTEMEAILLEREKNLEKLTRLENDLSSLNERLNESDAKLRERPTTQDLEERENEIKFLSEDLERLEREKLQSLESASQQIEVLEDQIIEQEEQIKTLEIQNLNFETEIACKDNDLLKLNDKVRVLEASLLKESSKVEIMNSSSILVDKAVGVDGVDSDFLGTGTPANEASLPVDDNSFQLETINVVAENLQQEQPSDDNGPTEDLGQNNLSEFRDQEQRIIGLSKEISQLRLQLEEKNCTVERLAKEAEQFLQVIRTKDELLIDLQTADLEDANSDSRRKIIGYIRELEENAQSLEEKISEQEGMINHYTNQLALMKSNREKLLEGSAAKDEQLSELNERLENIEARSQAKEHASSLLHHEHQRLLELNHSQGEEIAKLREKIQTLQISLQAKQDQQHQLIAYHTKCGELEKEISAFQGEEERLLTLIHEKDSKLRVMQDSLKQADLSDISIQLEIFKEKVQVLEQELCSTKGELDETSAKLQTLEEERFRPSAVEEPSIEETQRSNSAVTDVAVSCQLEPVNEHSVMDVEDGRTVFSQLEMKELQAELTRAHEEHAFIKAKYSEIKQQRDRIESEKRQELARQQDVVNEQNQHIITLQKEISAAKEAVKDLQSQHESTQRQSKAEFEQKIRLLVQDFESKLSLKEEEIKECMKKIELLSSVNRELKSAESVDDANKAKVQAVLLELEKVSALHQEQQHEVSNLRAELGRYKNIVSASDAALDKTQEDNRGLKLSLEKATFALGKFEEEKKSLQRRVQELETDIRRLTVSYREVEAKAAKDMERLRNHLIEMEEGYTNDALASQQQQSELEKANFSLEKELEDLRIQLQEVSTTSQRQKNDFQMQLSSLATQRDNLVLQLSTAQDQVHQHTNAMNNLQRALERFQKDKEAQQDILAEESKRELSKAMDKITELREKEKDYEIRINEAKLAVQGVSNLSRQLEMKDTENDELRQHVSILTSQIHQLEDEIQSARMASESKLDKALVKNVMLGYFHTPENKRADVVHVLGNLLDFSKDEIDQVGTGAPPSQRGWMSSILPFAGAKNSTANAPNTPTGGGGGLDKTFAEAFVSFLEQESGAANKNPSAASRKLASLLLSDPSASSTPFRGPQLWSQPSLTPNTTSVHAPSSSSISTSALGLQTAKATTSALFYSSRPVLFPAPGQEIPKVHTHTANSALKNLLAS